MLRNLRGYNTIYGTWRTAQRVRGLSGPPNDFYEKRGDSSTDMDYEEFCAALEAAGVNWLRCKLVGWQNPIGARAASLEPPPAGTYNIWRSVLNPSNLATYRSQQVTAPVPASTWDASNLGQLVKACERHGVKLHLILADQREFGSGWYLHAWNVNNQYLNGVRCEPQDRGFMTDARNVFTNPEAIRAFQDRFDFVLAAIAGHEDVVNGWELIAEITSLLSPKFWGTNGWDAAFKNAVLNKVRPWIETQCAYIAQHSDAPTSIGQVRHYAVTNDTVLAQVYDVPSLDVVLVNAYDNGNNPAALRRQLADTQKYYPQKQVVVMQYHPDGTATRSEASPWRASKEVEWVTVCGSPGMVGPLRWPDRVTGTYASPNLREIAGITATMAKAAKLDEWTRGQIWDGKINSSGLGLESSWGDGRHVSAYLRWADGGNKSVTVSGLSGDECTVYSYDYLTGNQTSTKTVPIAGGNAVFSVPTRDARAAVLVVPEGDTIPPVEDDKRTLVVRAVLSVDGVPDGEFVGTLTEIE